MAVTIRKKSNADGTTSIYLDIYFNGKRKYKFLDECKQLTGNSAEVKQGNKARMKLAEQIRVKQEHEINTVDHGFINQNGSKTLVLSWMDAYADTYTKKDIRNLKGAINKFRHWTEENKISALTFGRLTEEMIERFRDDLLAVSTGEGAASYFARFKKVMKAAHRARMMQVNPAAEVQNKKNPAEEKEVLTKEEILQFAETPTEAENVRDAFVFSCMTGLRFCDVKQLSPDDVKGRQLIVTQAKTSGKVIVDLNDRATAIIKKYRGNNPVFNLPSANGANKTIRAIARRAKIDKYLSWHCARHSTGTNLVLAGAHPKTIASVLGHASIKYSERYMRALDDLKKQATDSLNF